ncbi:MAG: cell envelope integrity protein TolA [Nitrospirota bacterium]
MKSSGIQADLLYSLLFHILSLVIAIIIAKNTFTMRASAPYVVSLIDSATLSAPGGVREENASTSDASPQNNVEQSAPETTRVVTEAPKKLSKKEDDALVSDRIAALRAKKKIERMAALRKIVDIGGARKSVSSRATSAASGAKAGSTDTGSVTGGGDYYSLVQSKIRQQWVFPETIERDMETVISIKIARDGKVTIDRIEKSSGNPLFDRSVVRAIMNASPLPQPFHDMEIGVRFRP